VNGERARLAEVLAALSLATDLGAAWPPETALKTCLVGVGLARRVGLGEPDVGDLEQGEDRERGARAAAHLLSPAGKALADQMCLAHRDVGRRFATRLGLTGAVGGARSGVRALGRHRHARPAGG
jgi:hypothetical protein